MEILGLKIPLFLDFVKSRKNCLYLRERKGKKLNGQVKVCHGSKSKLAN